MRLVSAIWNDHYPFHELGLFEEFVATRDPDDLCVGDVLLVWGGEDISPALYKHGRSRFSGASDAPSYRDAVEWALMLRAKELKLPIIGVCRGAQMLCALAGGHLYQHVENHGGHHEVTTFDGQKFMTNSLHHQMMAPENTKHKVLAWTKPRSDGYYYRPDGGAEIVLRKKDTNVDPEFVHFTDVNGYAVQWHPEMTDYPDVGTEYVLQYIRQHIGS